MENNEIDIQFVHKVKKRNTGEYVFLKFFTGFFVIFLISIILGILFCKATVKGVSDTMKQQISGHFKDVFCGCETMSDYFSVIISASSADFRYLVLIFTAGFTFFCKYATAAMIAVRAFTVGFSSEFIISAVQTNAIEFSAPWIYITLFTTSRLLVLALIVYLSIKATVFGDDFRRLRWRKSLILRSPVIYRYIFLFLTALGLVIIFNAGYCFLSSLI